MNTIELPKSKLTYSQFKTIEKIIPDGRIVVNIRYDDRCKNGHNSFSITGQVYDKHSRRGEPSISGCIHEEISKHFPELSGLIKWHLCSSDEPMHYVANTIYHINNSNLDAARSCAIAPDATLEQLSSELWLLNRLPKLMEEFKQTIESIGFEY